MSTKNAEFKVNNGTSWDKYHFETGSELVIHSKTDGTQTTAKAALNTLLNDAASGNLGGFRILYKRITLNYYNATELNGYVYCGAKVLAAVASIVYKDSTPMQQVNALVTKPGTIASTRVDVSAFGTGFVSGHVLSVDIIVITQPE